MASMMVNLAVNLTIEKFIINPKITSLTIKMLVPVIVKLFLLLEHILCIDYPIQFKKNQVKVKVLLDFRNKIDAIILVYMAKLNLKV